MATLLFLLILAVCLEACTANTTSSGLKALACSAGNFTAGDNAVVTCHLPTDVSATMHHVYITWYPFNTTNVYKDVITCFRRRNGLLKCDVLDGYKYDNVISDTLIFEIPKITPDFAGRYSCLLVPPWGPPPDLCTLHVKTDITRADNTKARGTPQTEPEDAKSFSTLEIILFVVCSLLVITLIVIVIVIGKCGSNPQGGGGDQGTSSSTQELETSKGSTEPLTTVSQEAKSDEDSGSSGGTLNTTLGASLNTGSSGGTLNTALEPLVAGHVDARRTQSPLMEGSSNPEEAGGGVAMPLMGGLSNPHTPLQASRTEDEETQM